MLTRRNATIAIGAIAAAWLMALQPHATWAEEGASVEWRTETRATVESVDPTRREVLLRDGTGDLVTVELGPEVRNLPQVKAGDRVVVSYRLGVTTRLAQPGSPPPSDGSATVQNAPAGAKPGQSISEVSRARVRIESVDLTTRTVALIGPRGIPRRFTLETPEMLDFASRLKPGDEVDVTFSELTEVKIQAP